jgi:PAS domain S-box-containing protein
MSDPDRKKTRVDTLDKSTLFELLFKHTLDCVVLLDRDFNFIRVNEAYAKACRRDVSDFPGHNHFEFYPSDAKVIFENVIKTKQPFEISARPFVFPDHPGRGTTYWDWTLVPVLDDTGEVELLIFKLKDVTKRARAEQELKQEKEKAQTYLDIVRTMIVALDRSGKVTLVNKRGCEILGYPEEEIVGKNWFENFLPPRIKDEIGNVFALLMKGEMELVEYYENPILTKSGEERDLAWHNILIKNDKGRIIGTFASAEDITERKQAEDAIKASLKEKEVLLREVYHRVKNNMQVIISLLRIQSRSIPDPLAREAFIDTQERIKAMSLVHETLYQSESLSTLDFRTYVEKLISNLTRAYSVKKSMVDISIDVKDAVFTVDDIIPLGLIINELVSNSLKHAFEKEGRIQVKLKQADNNNFELVVSDNGRGLPEDIDFNTTETMGLQLVKDMAKGQLEGSVKIFREKGSQFVIKFKDRTHLNEA